MKRALVTGATGFLGGFLARKLASRGIEVHALVRSSSKRSGPFKAHVHDGSLRGLGRILDAARADTVFHLAAAAAYQHAEEGLDALLQANLTLGIHLAEAASRRGCRVFVNAGTFWQHSDGKPSYSPVSLYAAMKQAFVDVLAYYAVATPMKVATLELFDVYGPGDPRDKLLAQLDRARSGGLSARLSPGKQLVQMIHVDDAAEAFVHAARLLESGRAASGSCWTAASKERRTLREVVKLYRDVVGPVDVRWGGRPYRAREVMRPFTGRPLPGWRPKRDLRRGLAELAERRGA